MRRRIKSNKVEGVARQGGDRDGERLTVWPLKGRQSTLDLAETLIAISRHCNSLPDLDAREADEILDYDETGFFR
jgi:hypothetical protein